MEATIVQDKTKHYPVLLKEIISIISPQYGGTFIDCTFGQGGYTREILKNKENKVIGIDRDSESLKIAKEIESESVALPFPVSDHLFIGIFVFFMSIIMINLLFGLAVSDVQVRHNNKSGQLSK